MNAILNILLFQDAFSAWVFSNSSSLSVVVSVVISTWIIAMKFGAYQNRFTNIDTDNKKLNVTTERINLQVQETKGDVKSMKVEIKAMKSTMNAGFNSMREEMKEMRGDIKDMRGQMNTMQGQMDLVIKLLTDKSTSDSGHLKKI